ncbi:hypothetical protein [Sphingobacterium hungaricum]|uniref:Uncharacterized protein n=1 Tax=Sphingobacterium hungaricum TaxID=2082723 RepID=A0A928YQX5_9SPHI|nr:hypothetical protein [Sphingobacterium hungaricum]MBE8714404.1 hypothetical protein [Sphingobacterium hungaricum]
MMFLLSASNSFGQIDTNLVYEKADNIIRLIENNKIDSLLISSTDSIRCLPCNEVGLKQYINSKIFFTQRLQEIFTPNLIARLKNAEKLIVEESEPYPSYVVFYKIFGRDEIAFGHEGATFGIWLRSNEKLKFTAIETIP